MSLDMHADKVAAIGREEKKWQMFGIYQCGKTNYRTLAKDFDCSVGQVGILINECLAELAEQRKELGMKIIEAEIGRLDELLDYWSFSKKRNDESELRSDTTADLITSNIIKIMNRRAKYLGLDAPEKRELDTGPNLKDLILKSIGDPESPKKSD